MSCIASSTFRFDTAWIMTDIQEFSRRRYINRDDIDSKGTLLLVAHHQVRLRNPDEPTLLGRRHRFLWRPHTNAMPGFYLDEDQLSTLLTDYIQLSQR
jgi:hypothetical protein